MELKKLTIQEWLEMLPCKIYDKKENKSYLIIAVTKNGLYYHDTVQCLNDDDFSWSPYDTVFSPSYLHLDSITTEFELGIEPTEKQIEWLERYDKMTKSMTKQEAWQIINKAVNEYKGKLEAYNKNITSKYVSKVLDKMLDVNDIVGQCGGCYEEDDFYC